MQKISYDYLIQPDKKQTIAKYRILDRKTYALFWEMGTGKTKVVIDFVAGMVKNVNPNFRCIVVCPLTVIATWEEQIEENAPFLTYSVMSSEETPCWDVNIILTSYDHFRPRKRKLKITPTGKISRRKRKVLDKTKLKQLIGWLPHLVVADESHKIKSRKSRQSKAMWELGDGGSEYKVLLTGTPIGNRPLDVWSQFRFLNPGILDEDYDNFEQAYAVKGGFGGFRILGYKNLPRLAGTVSPFVMKRKAEDMPAQNFISVPVDMPSEVKKAYKQLENEFLTFIEGRELRAPMVLARMSKLSQMSGGFVIHPDGERQTVHKAKLEALAEKLEEMKENEIERVVIFCRFKWEIDRIHEVCKVQGWETLEISGRISRDKRKEAEQQFKRTGGAIICQIAVGSVGINLQSANYAIFYSVDYSFINFEQAVKRIHRRGQTKPCFYYLLRCRGTIDTTIYSILRGKKEVADEFHSLIKEIRGRAA